MTVFGFSLSHNDGLALWWLGNATRKIRMRRYILILRRRKPLYSVLFMTSLAVSFPYRGEDSGGGSCYWCCLRPCEHRTLRSIWSCAALLLAAATTPPTLPSRPCPVVPAPRTLAPRAPRHTAGEHTDERSARRVGGLGSRFACQALGRGFIPPQTIL